MKTRLHRKILSVASQAALQAGRLVGQNAGRLKSRQIEAKSTNNFVTTLDRRSEALIVESIRKHFPDHALLAEESGAGGKKSDYVWIIDPIDGTSNFIHGYPLFSISIGVTEKGRLIAGVVYDPSHQELFSARRGGGAFLNNRRIRVSSVSRLGEALLVTGVPFRGFNRFEAYMDSFRSLSLNSAGVRRGGSAALDLAYVASGRLDTYWEMGLSPWDIAAGALLVTEAGGRVSDLRGQGGFLQSGDILATNGALHTQALRFTRKIPPRK